MRKCRARASSTGCWRATRRSVADFARPGGASERAWKREQRKVGTEGWGSRLLALQDADGRWAGGVYTPKWTSTTYTRCCCCAIWD